MKQIRIGRAARRRVVLGAVLALLAAGCGGLLAGSKKDAPAQSEPAVARASEPEITIVVDASVPAARDDGDAPVLQLQRMGPPEHPVPVPFLYGYPLYAGGGGVHGLRRLRQDNWTGYERSEHEDADGVVRVTENFPELGCRFDGIAEEPGTYVPLQVQCDLPAPAALGGRSRPVVGDLRAGARPDKVPKEPILAKAFMGDWHATSPGFDGKNGSGYFNAPGGLIAFGFERGKLTSVAFLFDPPEERWRDPMLWMPP